MFDRDNVGVLDLAHYLYVFIKFQDELIYDTFPNADMCQICEAMEKAQVVHSAMELMKKALDCEKRSIYEPGYDGFGPVCEVLGITDDGKEGTKLYCIIIALYAQYDQNFREECFNIIEDFYRELEKSDEISLSEEDIKWTANEKQDMRYVITSHWLDNIYGKGL